jgi:hypothetical protein
MYVLDNLDLLKMTLGEFCQKWISMLLPWMISDQYLFKHSWKEELSRSGRKVNSAIIAESHYYTLCIRYCTVIKKWQLTKSLEILHWRFQANYCLSTLPMTMNQCRVVHFFLLCVVVYWYSSELKDLTASKFWGMMTVNTKISLLMKTVKYKFGWP